MELAWKACVPQGTEGSNPSLSAIDSPYTSIRYKLKPSFLGQIWGSSNHFLSTPRYTHSSPLKLITKLASLSSSKSTLELRLVLMPLETKHTVFQTR